MALEKARKYTVFEKYESQGLMATSSDYIWRERASFVVPSHMAAIAHYLYLTIGIDEYAKYCIEDQTNGVSEYPRPNYKITCDEPKTAHYCYVACIGGCASPQGAAAS